MASASVTFGYPDGDSVLVVLSVPLVQNLIVAQAAKSVLAASQIPLYAMTPAAAVAPLRVAESHHERAAVIHQALSAAHPAAWLAGSGVDTLCYVAGVGIVDESRQKEARASLQKALYRHAISA